MPKQMLYLQSKLNEFLQTYLIILITHLLLIFLNEDFFLRIYRDGIKSIFQNTRRVFLMAKIKHTNNNF